MRGVEFQSVKGGFRVYAVFGEEGAIERKSGWETLFDVEDPRKKVPQSKGKFIDVNQALEVARQDIQYCDWRARQDVLAIMLLHEKVPPISCYLNFLYCFVNIHLLKDLNVTFLPLTILHTIVLSSIK